jgi:hypothetical protein
LLPGILAIGVSGASCAATPDDDLFGMTLEVESAQPFAASPDLRARLHRIIEEGSAYIGLGPSRLYGMRLRIVDGGVSCGGLREARGCFRRDEIVVSTLAWISTEPPVPCVEDTPLPHELLHALIEDPAHEDPRWDDPGFWDPLRERLRQPDCCSDPATRLW